MKASFSFLESDIILRPTFCLSVIVILSVAVSSCHNAPGENDRPLPEDLAAYFSPPQEFVHETAAFTPKLSLPADKEEWEVKRQEILNRWHAMMGEWPEVIENPQMEYLDTVYQDSITRYKINLEVAKGWTRGAYLLVPDQEGPLPAALVVYYEPETAVGLGRLELRDFALQLAKRGFVTLSLGSNAGSNYYPNKDSAYLQPLSMLAYMAANAYHGLANLPMVDPERIGVTGHSYGGKWAMFASCLYDKFALGVWSDGGVVFDETRPNVNYWEPWYLGYQHDKERKPGTPSAENPRTGAYKQMIEQGMDLHELHALMAPRPFLVSGGAEDTPKRWAALNKTVELNKVLGYENRVAMQNRPTHAPNEESNEVMYRFFEHFLR